jgi:hypothetical protein
MSGSAAFHGGESNETAETIHICRRQRTGKQRPSPLLPILEQKDGEFNYAILGYFHHSRHDPYLAFLHDHRYRRKFVASDLIEELGKAPSPTASFCISSTKK